MAVSARDLINLTTRAIRALDMPRARPNIRARANAL